MNDFELFDKALQECANQQDADDLSKSEEEKDNEIDKDLTVLDSLVCTHKRVIIESGIVHCTDCGEEVMRDDKDWKFINDNVHLFDPNRCQIRKIEERSIFKDVEGMNFPEKIVAKANEIYSEVTKKKKKHPDDPDEFQIYRGNSRKAIIFACIFSAYKLNGTPETWEDLSAIFGLERKDCSNGIKHISKNAPKKSPIRTTYITPDNLVDNIMDKFEATKEQKQEVKEIYKKIENTSYKLNQSRPKSVASGLVFYWIQKSGKDITLKEFTEKVELSEITVEKISKEISRVLNEKQPVKKKTKKEKVKQP